MNIRRLNKKQYIVEFGIRGGQHRQIHPLPLRQAIDLAADMVAMFLYRPTHKNPELWERIGKDNPRITWQSETHFVALSLLDGIPRGPASATLWKRADGKLVDYIKPIPVFYGNQDNP